MTPSLTELAHHLTRRLGHGVGFDRPGRLGRPGPSVLRRSIFPAYRGSNEGRPSVDRGSTETGRQPYSEREAMKSLAEEATGPAS